jgi:hypothetical protein
MQTILGICSCAEPDWHTVDSSKTAAMAQLIKLGEWLGCRDSPRALSNLKSACLQRGADVILAAVQRAGGAQALAAADPAAAISLCHGLMQLPDRIFEGVELEFAALGPDLLRTAAADVHSNVPGAPQCAYNASWLANLFLQRHAITAPAGQQLELQLGPSLQAQKQVACRHDMLMHSPCMKTFCSISASALLHCCMHALAKQMAVLAQIRCRYACWRQIFVHTL